MTSSRRHSCRSHTKFKVGQLVSWRWNDDLGVASELRGKLEIYLIGGYGFDMNDRAAYLVVPVNAEARLTFGEGPSMLDMGSVLARGFKALT